MRQLEAQMLPRPQSACGSAAAHCGKASPYRCDPYKDRRLRLRVEAQPLPDKKMSWSGKAEPFRHLLWQSHSCRLSSARFPNLQAPDPTYRPLFLDAEL